MEKINQAYYQDKVALITGAASGFGLGFTEKILELGAKSVWMGDYAIEGLAKAAAGIAQKYPGKVHAIVCDCSKKEDVFRFVQNAAEEEGGLDFLFNNAGIACTYPLINLPPEKFLELVQVNYLGVVYGTMAALPFLEAQGWGHVINTASAGGLMPFPYQSSYASTKAAVISFTQCLDIEYSDRDIHFTSISPANVATNIFKTDVIAKMRQEGHTEEEIEDAIKNIPVPKDAIPLNEAVDYIFARIPQQEVNIIVGDEPKEAYNLYKKDYNTFKERFESLRVSRKAYFEAIARGEKPAFPG
ncbi:MAG: SDR family oxidoreductase [Megasphaera sp.]|jgi:NAD(P)-dependent dehydrogenase (short-subunit alcohol dehydrogenase family)|nr:SDR family oxidoreductase [Megasphaera sp.]